jgi:hypothetical protein
MTPYSLVEVTDASEERTASIFRVYTQDNAESSTLFVAYFAYFRP